MHYIAESILYEIKKNLIHGENRRDQTCTFMMKIRFGRISISAILTQISQFLKTIKSLEMHGVHVYTNNMEHNPSYFSFPAKPHL